MNSRPLRVEVRRILLERMAEQGLGNYRVLADYQPTSQGREQNAVYFFEVSDNRSGWQGRSYTTPTDESDGQRHERQTMQTVMQFGAFVDKDRDITAKDLLNNVALIINSLGFILDASKENIGVQRVTDIRTPYFKNESDRFEMSPSFDVTFSYTRTLNQSQEFTDAVPEDVHSI